MACAIDEEVKRILDDAYERAKQSIRDNRAKMVKLAATLMEVETLDRASFERLMNEVDSAVSGSANGEASESVSEQSSLDAAV